MQRDLSKMVFLILFIFTFLIPISQVASAQELGTGAKLIGTPPFLFAKAKFWIFAVEVGVGPNLGGNDSSEYGYESKPYTISGTGKIYPIDIAGLSPYFGASNWFSLVYKQTRLFAGVEFGFPGEGLPLSTFAGGGLAFTEAEGAGLSWHLGVKYTFSF